jgi:hypothetical protein
MRHLLTPVPRPRPPSAARSDRESLRPSLLEVGGCDIHHFGLWKRTYMPGLAFNGVAYEVIDNRVHHGPHEGITGR